MSGDEYVYDEASGEWLPAIELARRQATESSVVVRDAVEWLLKLQGKWDELVGRCAG